MYTHITVDFYGENLEYIKELRVDGVDTAGTQEKLYIQTEANRLINGWNSVSFDISQVVNKWDLFSNKIRLWGSIMDAYKADPATYTSHVYFDSIYASNTLTVTNSHSGKIKEGAEYVVSDNSATVFANCTNLTLKVYTDNGIITVEDGKFTPVGAGNYMFVYTATDANGKAVRATYAVNLTVEEAGLINDFATNDWTPAFNGVWVSEYDGKTGLIQANLSAAENGGPSTYKGLFCDNKKFALYEKEEYAGATKLNFLMKIEKSNPNLKIEMTLNNNANAAQLDYKLLSNSGEGNTDWIVVSMNFDSYYAVFDTIATKTKLAFQLKLPADKRDEENLKNITATVYIDKVWVE